jgi:hypothetical protein
MNRFNYNEANSEDSVIKVGMAFTGTGGHVSKIVDRLSTATWSVSHFNPVTHSTTFSIYNKNIILTAIADAKRPDSLVKITYE